MALLDKEIWKPIRSLKGKTTKNYGVSNLGRICTYTKSLADKTILKLHDNGGFPTVSIRVNSKSKAIFPHREVANEFIKKPNSKYTYVLHLNHNKKNNQVNNLKWATKEQQSEHNKNNPIVKKAISQRIYAGATAKKLTDAKVLKLKTEIYNPKRKLTLKQLAEKYGIAEMNLYRIKSGLFWYHIHVEGEPIHEKYKLHLKNVELSTKKETISIEKPAKKEKPKKEAKDSKKNSVSIEVKKKKKGDKKKKENSKKKKKKK